MLILHCDLDLWPLDLELLKHFGCHAFKFCTKFERNQINHGWVIDALARRTILRAGTFYRTVLRGPWTHFTELGEDIGRSFLHKKFVSACRYLAAFSNAGGSKKTTPNFALFDPMRKLGVGGINNTNYWSFTYGRTSGIHLMAIHCAAAERVW